MPGKGDIGLNHCELRGKALLRLNPVCEELHERNVTSGCESDLHFRAAEYYTLCVVLDCFVFYDIF